MAGIGGHDRNDAGVAHLGDIETALRREIDIMRERFPGAPPDDVAHLVRQTYADIERNAEIDTHVLSLPW